MRSNSIFFFFFLLSFNLKKLVSLSVELRFGTFQFKGFTGILYHFGYVTRWGGSFRIIIVIIHRSHHHSLLHIPQNISKKHCISVFNCPHVLIAFVDHLCIFPFVDM